MASSYLSPQAMPDAGAGSDTCSAPQLPSGFDKAMNKAAALSAAHVQQPYSPQSPTEIPPWMQGLQPVLTAVGGERYVREVTIVLNVQHTRTHTSPPPPGVGRHVADARGAGAGPGGRIADQQHARDVAPMLRM